MPKHILISRTDAIGDVVLTLPLCGFIKDVFKDVTITFLGRTYTKPVADCCSAIDHFLNLDDLTQLSDQEQAGALKRTGADVVLHVFPNRHISSIAKKAGIKVRVGTRNRWYHWLTCNKLASLSRRNSSLHEAELNLRLLSALGVSDYPALNELYHYYHFKPVAPLPAWLKELVTHDQINVVLHPGSNRSAPEWSLAKYRELIQMLPREKYRVFISGSAAERESLKDLTTTFGERVTDLSGKLSLAELIAFYKAADALIASSTGTLHLAAAAGISTLGIFQASKPVHAGRWGPLGEKAGYITSETDNIEDVPVSSVMSWLEPLEK